ncbi:hypothetical protein GCM10025782_09720 [Pedococcus ginsenosidimutans]|uniref:Uncharacterized protein n=1 Tax=Pedococcus ginsenosidimutans TaxID=490570 RepID=A0ABP8XW34_9MICO
MATVSSPRPTVVPGARRAGLGGWPATLVHAAAGLALVGAALGLVLEGVYTGPRSTAEILRGDDLVTALVVVPALVVATGRARRGSTPAHAVVAGLLADLVYTYAFYVFGTGFNDLFLLHVATFSTSLAALLLVVVGLDVDALRERLRPWRHARAVAVALGVLAVSLGGMWVAGAVANAVDGTVPVGSRLVEEPSVIHLALVLDLGVQVPLYAAASVLVWRHTGWGCVLAVVALVSGVPEQLSYLVGMPMQVAAGVPGAVSSDALEPVILAFYVVGLVLLVLGSGRVNRPTG